MSSGPEFPPSPLLDWTQARDRLDEIARRLDGPLSPESVQTRMARRAAVLATPEPTEETTPPLELIAFSLAGMRYAIPLSATAAVTPVDHLVRLPDTEPVHLGILVHRGALFALVDPNRLLDRQVSMAAPPTLAVLVDHPDCAIALAADTLIGVVPHAGPLPASTLARGGPVIALMPDGTPDGIHVLSADALARNARLIVDHRPRLSPAS